jgi:hypothetical protein
MALPGNSSGLENNIIIEEHEREQRKRIESLGDYSYREKRFRDFSRLAKQRAFQKRIKMLLLIGIPVIYIVAYYLISIIQGH